MRYLCLALCLLVGCGKVEPPADFVYITDAPHNRRDPQKMSYMHDIRMTHNLFETLVNLDFETGDIEPAAATHWEISKDGLTYTFHLRENAQWSNGDPVTADDFVFAWRRAMTPDLATPYATLIFYIRGAEDFFAFRNKQISTYTKNVEASEKQTDPQIAELAWQLAVEEFERSVGLRATDERTLVVELRQPTPFFLQLTAFVTFMPVHRASVEAATTFNVDTGTWQVDHAYWHDRNRLVTNGPYVLGDVKFRQYTDLRASQTYWNRSAMRNHSIRELIVESPTTALLLYRRGQADFWPGAPSGKMGQDLLQQLPNDAHPIQMAGTYYYNYNCSPKLPNGRDNPLADARVRRALTMAIDRDALVKHVTGMGEPPAYTFVPPGAVGGYDPPINEAAHFDPLAAKALLAEAGYDDPATLTELSILYAPISVHEKVAQAIKGMWRQHLGVTVALEAADPKASSQRKHDRQYVISRSSWFGDYPDPNTWLEIRTTDAPNNTASWSNAQYDQFLASAANETDPVQRLTMLRDAETILVREQPMAPLFHYVMLNLYDETKVSGLAPNAWGRWRMEFVNVNRE